MKNQLMKEKRALCTGLLLSAAIAVSVVGCGSKKSNELLHLSFDEGTGNQVTDAVSKQSNEISYVFTKTPFNTQQDPQWREQGVQGGCLLFDGSSNAVAYEPDAFAAQGEAFSISVWVAPRTFEWDDPNAADAGNAHLTAIAGQYNKDHKI